MFRAPINLATAALIGLAFCGAAHGASPVYLSDADGKRAAMPDVVMADSLDAVERALVSDAEIDTILIDSRRLEDLDPLRLRALYELGLVVAVTNGKVSQLAEILAVDTNLTDYAPVNERQRVKSIALLMALFDDSGQINGHHAFTDGVADLAQALDRIALMKGGFEASLRAQKAACSWGNLGLVNFTGPAGTNVTGWTQVGCDGSGWQYGNAITATSDHDQVKIVTVTYNNCSYWHQISSTIRYGTNYVSIPDPGVLAGDPGQCGTKFQADSVHSARKGSTWFSHFTSSCAGAC